MGVVKLMGSKEKAERCVLSLKMAVYHAVHDYPGGVGAVAGAHGRNASVLQNKLNPNMDSHHINLSDLEQIIISTQDQRILQSICSLYGAGYFMLPHCEAENASLMEKCADVNRELGELMQEISASLADGKVTRDEIRALDRALMEFTAAGAGLVAYAKQVGGVE